MVAREICNRNVTMAARTPAEGEILKRTKAPGEIKKEEEWGVPSYHPYKNTHFRRLSRCPSAKTVPVWSEL